MAKKKETKKPGKIKIELTPFSIFLWSLFALFMLAWVFVLGIFAGRGFLPGTIPGLDNPLKKLKQAVIQKDEYEYEEPKTDPAFVFYDNLESKKNEVKRRSIPPKEKEASQKITLSRDETASLPEKPKPEETVEAKEVKQEKTLPEATPQEYFSVQIASISDHGRAETLVKELVDQDYDAYYYGATVDGKNTYRIMCGRFARRSEAVLCLNKLKRDTGYKGFIIKVDR